MAPKNWIKFKVGLFRDPKHRQEMGDAIWLYGYLIDHANWETGIVDPYKDADCADEMSASLPWVRKYRRILTEKKYIEAEQLGPKGMKITIIKWVNPRSYSGEVLNPEAKSDTPVTPSEKDSDLESDLESDTDSDPDRTPFQVQTVPASGIIDQESEKPTPLDPPTEHPFVRDCKKFMGLVPTPSMLDFLYRMEAERDEAFILEAIAESEGKPYAYLKTVIENCMAEKRRPGEKKGATVQEKPKEHSEEERERIAAEQQAEIQAREEAAAQRKAEWDALSEEEKAERTARKAALKVWDTAYGQLQLQLPRETFDTWLRSAVLQSLDMETSTYTLKLANRFAYEWVTGRFAHKIQRQMDQVAGKPVKLVFTYEGKPEEPDPFGDITDKLAKPAPGDDGFGSIDTKLKPEYQGKKIA